jgi:ABC-type transport system involved in multi-copper enzyme maturation permease subunit
MQLIYQWLWRLAPGNPMVVRIVQGGSRRPRHLWVRMGYLAALIALVLIMLLSGGGLGSDISLNDLAKAGAAVFGVVSYGQVILVCLLAPLFMATAIAAEQSGKTYNILLTTPLTNLQIVLGTLLGRLFFVLALLLSGLPLFAVLLIFGGVPIRSIFLAFAVAGLTALMVGAVAVTLSVLRAGGRKAVFVFVVGIVAYLILAAAVDVMLLRQGGQSTWLTPLHPLLVLETSTNSQYRPPADQTLMHLPALWRWYRAHPFSAFAALTGLASGVLVVFCSLVLRRVGQGELAAVTWLKKKLRLGAGERRRKPRSVWSNPIAWREANTRGKLATAILARWGFLVVALIVAVAVVMLYHHGLLPQRANPNTGQPLVTQDSVFRGALVTLMLVELTVIALVAIYMAAGCVSREREDGTLDLILTTPVTPKRYIWGKLRGLVSYLTLMGAAPVLTLAIVAGYVVIGQWRQWPQAMTSVMILNSQGSGGSGPMTATVPMLLWEAPVLLAIVLGPFVALCVAVGMNWSLKAKGVLGAVTPAVGVIAALTLFTAFCGVQAAANIPLVGPVLNALSPATNIFMILDPWETVYGFGAGHLGGRINLFIAALLAAGVYGLVVYAMIGGMVKGFDHTVRKLTGTT